MKFEQELLMEVTTAQQNTQVERKIKALIRGGYEIVGIDLLEKHDPDTGKTQYYRQVIVFGEEIKQDDTASV